jgi:WD40 repeat protein
MIHVLWCPGWTRLPPDGRTLASGSFDGRLRLWDTRTRKQLGRPLRGHTDAVYSVAFSPDGRTLVSGGGDGTVRLWDTRTRKQLGRPLRGHTGPVGSVAFSPNGRTLASGSLDGTARLWRGIFWNDFSDIRTQVCRLVTGNLTKAEWIEFAPGVPYRTTCPK